MICPKCGREISDGAVCTCSVVQPTPILSSNPALNAIKTIGSSRLFLTAAILYSVSIVLNLWTSVVGDSTYDIVSYYTGVDLSAYANSNMLNMILSAVAASAFTILIAIGMWLHYSTCRRTDTGNISTAGLTICKVMFTITTVLMAISAVLSVILLLFVAVSADSIAYYLLNYFWYLFDAVHDINDFAVALAIVAIMLIIFVIIYFTLAIIYYVLLIKTTNRIKTTALTGVPDNRISRFVIAMNYISAVFSGIGGLVMLISSPFTGLALLCSAVSTVLISICLSRYRKQSTILMYPPIQPVYAQPVQQMYTQPAAPVQPDDNENQ